MSSPLPPAVRQSEFAQHWALFGRHAPLHKEYVELHCVGGPQVPFVQVAPVPLASLAHEVPFGALGLEHKPVPVLHVPLT